MSPDNYLRSQGTACAELEGEDPLPMESESEDSFPQSCRFLVVGGRGLHHSRLQIECQGFAGNIHVGTLVAGEVLTAEDINGSKTSKFKTGAAISEDLVPAKTRYVFAPTPLNSYRGSFSRSPGDLRGAQGNKPLPQRSRQPRSKIATVRSAQLPQPNHTRGHQR